MKLMLKNVSADGCAYVCFGSLADKPSRAKNFSMSALVQ